jgi:hypothetical protein
MQTVTGYLDRWLDPVGRALNPDAARQLLNLQVDEETQRRVEELSDRNTEGELTDEERSEYQALVGASELVAVLQAKARLRLPGDSNAA